MRSDLFKCEPFRESGIHWYFVYKTFVYSWYESIFIKNNWFILWKDHIIQGISKIKQVTATRNEPKNWKFIKIVHLQHCDSQYVLKMTAIGSLQILQCLVKFPKIFYILWICVVLSPPLWTNTSLLSCFCCWWHHCLLSAIGFVVFMLLASTCTLHLPYLTSYVPTFRYLTSYLTLRYLTLYLTLPYILPYLTLP